MGTFLHGLLPSLSLKVLPWSHLFYCSLLFTFSINGHCSVVENNQTRKSGFVPFSQELFLSCLGVGGGGRRNKPLQLCLLNCFFQHLWWSFCLTDADSHCWRSKLSYQCLSGLLWGGDEASCADSCLHTKAQNPVTSLHMCHTMEDGYFLPLGKTQNTGNAVSEVKGRSYGLGGKAMLTNKASQIHFFFNSLFTLLDNMTFPKL